MKSERPNSSSQEHGQGGEQESIWRGGRKTAGARGTEWVEAGLVGWAWGWRWGSEKSGGDQLEVGCTGLDVGHSEVETLLWCGEKGKGLTARRVHRAKT